MAPQRRAVCFLALLLCSSLLLVRAADSSDDDYADEETFRGHLIVHKSLGSPIKHSDDLAYPLIVQGRNATVDITIHNTGTGTASNVELADVLPPNAQLLDGSLTATFPKIAAGSSVQHSYVLVFTSGGSMDVTLLPQATVKYLAEEGASQTGISTKPGAFILTPVQQITRYALMAGSYASLGICRSPADWRNMAIVLGVVGSILGTNWAVKQFKSSSTTTRRKKALQELEKDQ